MLFDSIYFWYLKKKASIKNNMQIIKTFIVTENIMLGIMLLLGLFLMYYIIQIYDYIENFENDVYLKFTFLNNIPFGYDNTIKYMYILLIGFFLTLFSQVRLLKRYKKYDVIFFLVIIICSLYFIMIYICSNYLQDFLLKDYMKIDAELKNIVTQAENINKEEILKAANELINKSSIKGFTPKIKMDNLIPIRTLNKVISVKTNTQIENNIDNLIYIEAIKEYLKKQYNQEIFSQYVILEIKKLPLKKLEIVNAIFFEKRKELGELLNANFLSVEYNPADKLKIAKEVVNVPYLNIAYHIEQLIGFVKIFILKEMTPYYGNQLIFIQKMIPITVLLNMMYVAIIGKLLFIFFSIYFSIKISIFLLKNKDIFKISESQKIDLVKFYREERLKEDKSNGDISIISDKIKKILNKIKEKKRK